MSSSIVRSHNSVADTKKKYNKSSATSPIATITISNPKINSDNSKSHNEHNEHEISHPKHTSTISTKISIEYSFNDDGIAINHSSQSGQRPVRLHNFIPNSMDAVDGTGDSISVDDIQHHKVHTIANQTSVSSSIYEIRSGGKQALVKMKTSFGLNSCPPIPPNLEGSIEVDKAHIELDMLEERFRDKLSPGGMFRPIECNPKDRVAIIVPYRDRPQHLSIFLNNIHPFLMKQQIEYGIFVVEQVPDELFNRASLMNIGSVEALKIKEWDCFIFHDVDLLPLDDRNLYTCPDQPRHMSVAVDTMGFRYDQRQSNYTYTYYICMYICTLLI